MQNSKKDTLKRKPVILFADDDSLCLNVGVKMLQKLGYSVLDARDGHEALEVFKDNQEEVDLVILDMKMPHNVWIYFILITGNTGYFKNIPGLCIENWIA